MAAITAQLVNELRQISGAGMMDCKKALTEANGDIEAAIDILRKNGQKVSAKRADREASEGSIFVHTNDNNTEAFMISLNCETDFVARNEEFVKLGEGIVKVASENKTKDVEALKSLTIGGRAISDLLIDLTGKIGEKIEITSYVYATGESVATYIHNGSKLGVVVSLNAASDAIVNAGREIGMQIAAMNPVAVDQSDIDEKTIARELEIGKEKARMEGKPENIVEKIAQGYVSKFIKENTLLNQPFVKDPKATVGEYLNSVEKGLTVKKFYRVSVNS